MITIIIMKDRGTNSVSLSSVYCTSWWIQPALSRSWLQLRVRTFMAVSRPGQEALGANVELPRETSAPFTSLRAGCLTTEEQICPPDASVAPSCPWKQKHIFNLTKHARRNLSFFSLPYYYIPYTSEEERKRRIIYSCHLLLLFTNQIMSESYSLQEFLSASICK